MTITTAETVAKLIGTKLNATVIRPLYVTSYCSADDLGEFVKAQRMFVRLHYPRLSVDFRFALLS